MPQNVAFSRKMQCIGLSLAINHGFEMAIEDTSPNATPYPPGTSLYDAWRIGFVAGRELLEGLTAAL